MNIYNIQLIFFLLFVILICNYKYCFIDHFTTLNTASVNAASANALTNASVNRASVNALTNASVNAASANALTNASVNKVSANALITASSNAPKFSDFTQPLSEVKPEVKPEVNPEVKQTIIIFCQIITTRKVD